MQWPQVLKQGSQGPYPNSECGETSPGLASGRTSADTGTSADSVMGRGQGGMSVHIWQEIIGTGM